MRAAGAASRECAGGVMQVKIAQWVCMLQVVVGKYGEHCGVVGARKVLVGDFGAHRLGCADCTFTEVLRERLLLAPGCCVFGI